MKNIKSSIIKFVKTYQKILIILLTPIIASVIPIVIKTTAAKCAFVVILMSVYWITVALPIGVTSLLPVLLYPAFGILQADKVAPIYFKDIGMFTFGGLLVANTIEATRLHERIALFVLLKFGSNPKWLLLGFMLVIAFLSLWISNTATTAMMLPVVDAVVDELIKNNPEYNISESASADSIEMANMKKESDLTKRDVNTKTPQTVIPSKLGKNLAKGFIISCSYAATIGGCGSLVGTSTNLVLKGYFDKFHPNANLNFLNYLLYGLPASIIMLIITWIWIIIRWMPSKKMLQCSCKKKVTVEGENSSLYSVLKSKYVSLGPMNWAQKSVGCIFVLLVILWITKDLQIVPGWDYFFKEKYTSDATAAIFAVLLLFIIPKDNIFAGKPYDHLVEWKTLQKTFPWDVILLIGGSLAQADGFQLSGLSDWIGAQLRSFSKLNKEALLILVQLVTMIATEFTSNVSIASIFLPITDAIVSNSAISPLFVMLPVVMSASAAFMLPVATPTNAIIFSTGKITVLDLITTGIVAKVIALSVIFLASNSWLGLVFDMDYRSFNTTIAFNTTKLATTTFNTLPGF